MNEPVQRNAVSRGGQNWIHTQRSTNIGTNRKIVAASELINAEKTRNQKQNNSMLNP